MTRTTRLATVLPWIALLLCACQSAGPANFSGTYSGTGAPSSAIGGACAGQIPVNGMVVNGTDVVFGAFHGTLNGFGGVQMQDGANIVQGYFHPGRFDGTWFQPYPACTYALTLQLTP